jgi:hypothetical protein
MTGISARSDQWARQRFKDQRELVGQERKCLAETVHSRIEGGPVNADANREAKSSARGLCSWSFAMRLNTSAAACGVTPPC